jgi:hypothetical protein
MIRIIPGGDPMSDPNETKKLLEFKATLENRLRETEQEITDIKKGLEQIDSIIINTGFRTFSTPQAPPPKLVPKPEPKKTTPEPKESIPDPEPEPSQPSEPIEGEDDISVTGKDGTLLGNLVVEGNTLTFTPSDIFEFTTDIPPFQSFLVERVLENMKRTDQERASNGELEPQDILEYSVETDGDKISLLKIVNYGGERRLRELNSSLRWTLDKMYDKLREG